MPKMRIEVNVNFGKMRGDGSFVMPAKGCFRQVAQRANLPKFGRRKILLRKTESSF